MLKKSYTEKYMLRRRYLLPLCFRRRARVSGNIVLSVHFHLRCCVLHVIYRYGKQSQGRKDKEDDSVVFVNHGVISEKPISLNCKSECVYRREKNKNNLHCYKKVVQAKKKRQNLWLQHRKEWNFSTECENACIESASFEQGISREKFQCKVCELST